MILQPCLRQAHVDLQFREARSVVVYLFEHLIDLASLPSEPLVDFWNSHHSTHNAVSRR